MGGKIPGRDIFLLPFSKYHAIINALCYVFICFAAWRYVDYVLQALSPNLNDWTDIQAELLLTVSCWTYFNFFKENEYVLEKMYFHLPLKPVYLRLAV
jgi:hypothetical protein